MSTFLRYFLFLFLLFHVDFGYSGDVTKSTNKETACDGYKMKMLCPASDRISVQDARYGRQDDRKCIVEPARMANTHCSLDAAAEIVANKCNGKSECTFTVDQSLFSDPCPGTSKYLQVSWNCERTVIKCPEKLLSVTKESAYVTKEKRYGAWMRDPLQHSQKIYFACETFSDAILYEYSSIKSFQLRFHSSVYPLPHRMDGTGFVVYDRFLFYNKERSRMVTKFDLANNRVVSETELQNANYHGTSPYAINRNTDIDFAVDENGLWAIYATETNNGNIVIAKLQHQTLNLLGTWKTSYEKLSALNAFVVCGVLYVVGYDSLQIEYMYNTTSHEERRIHISVPDLNQTTSAIDYNFQERMLYVWDSGVATRYSLHFDSVGFVSKAPTPHSVIPPTISSNNVVSNSPHPTQNQGFCLRESYVAEKEPQCANLRFDDVSSLQTFTVDSTLACVIVSHAHEIESASPSSQPYASSKLCLEITRNGLTFPNTTYANTATVDCPGTIKEKAIWTCGGSPSRPQWTRSGPDLSQCSSLWINELKHKIVENNLAPTKIASDLLTNLYERSGKLRSWDLIEIIELLKTLITNSISDTASASNVADSMLKICNEFLRPVQSKIWKGLDRKIQTKAATSLISVLEDAAFFLAQDMMRTEPKNNPSSNAQNRVMWSQHYATMAIRIEPVPKHSTSKNAASSPSPVVTLSSGHGDVVAVNDNSIIESLAASPGDKLAIVHLSLKNLGGHIADNDGFGAEPYPVNSKVVTLSTKLWNNGWLSTTKNHKLSLPISLRLQHNSDLYRQHVCAFWNSTKSSSEGQWWRSGCRRVSGNSSFSECHCDHLTNFVVLSSNRKFPLLGAEDNNEIPQDVNLHFNVVRGGMIVSVVFLFITLVILFLFKKNGTDVTTIHRNLLISLLLTQVIFVAGITQARPPIICCLVAAFLHYGVICTFIWAALLAGHHLMSLEHENRKRWFYCYALGYVFPLVIVGITVAADYTAFGSTSTCWIRTSGAFLWASIVPCGFTIIATLLLIGTLMWRLNRDNQTLTERNIHIRSHAACTCVIMFLLCVEWSASFLWNSGFFPLLTAWLLSTFSALCGIAAFILFCVLPPEVILPQRCWCFDKEDGSTRQTSFTNQPNLPIVQEEGMELLEEHSTSSAIARNQRRTSLTHNDSTDPKLLATPPNQIPLSNEYARPAMRRPAAQHDCRNDRTQRHYPKTFRDNAGQCYTAGSSSTCYSCCYDRLHDETLGRSAPHCNGSACSRCNLHSVSLIKSRSSHIYETLGPFTPQCFSDIQGYQLSSRNPHEDAEPFCKEVNKSCVHSSTMNHCSCFGVSHLPTTSQSIRTDCRMCRTGRSSDPLSTDQGYDTDSQQLPSAMPVHQCEEARNVKPPLRCKDERRTSPANSECISENDQEVELINSSTQHRRRATHQTCEVSPSSREFGEDDNSGRLNAFDTVTSWTAYSGTRLKEVYLKTKSDIQRGNLKAYPSLNVAQPRNKQEPRREADASFTLPGTSNAGLKTRIDLHNGRISMTTANL